MELVLLVVRSAFRNRLRAILTAVGVAVTLVAFLFLRTFVAAWYSGVESSSADRLIVRNKISIIFPLPLSYVSKIAGVAGVSDVSYENWFGGYYKEEKNVFAQFAADAESVLRVYASELGLPPEQKKGWLEDRKGCIIGPILAERFGWKVGDKIVLKGTIFPGDWEFNVRGIYTPANKNFDQQSMFFHWKYLNDSVPEGRKDQVGIILVRVADPGRSNDVATGIDKMYANSLAETRTESEKAFQLSFISMASAVMTAIQVVSGVILLILLLILGNTIAMATRERTTEYATMKAIGFQPHHINLLVMGEGFIIAAVGAALGVVLAAPIIGWVSQIFIKYVPGFLSEFHLELDVVLIGVVTVLALGITAAEIPARRASRLKIVDALRRLA